MGMNMRAVRELLLAYITIVRGYIISTLDHFSHVSMLLSNEIHANPMKLLQGGVKLGVLSRVILKATFLRTDHRCKSTECL
jgi:hypothetical protein